MKLTCNQVILLLDCHRGFLHTRHLGNVNQDIAALKGRGLIMVNDEPPLIPTPWGSKLLSTSLVKQPGTGFLVLTMIEELTEYNLLIVEAMAYRCNDLKVMDLRFLLSARLTLDISDDIKHHGLDNLRRIVEECRERKKVREKLQADLDRLMND